MSSRPCKQTPLYSFFRRELKIHSSKINYVKLNKIGTQVSVGDRDLFKNCTQFFMRKNYKHSSISAGTRDIVKKFA